MTDLELQAQRMTDSGRQLWDYCTDTLSAGKGSAVLAQLCAWIDPLGHSIESTPEQTAFMNGQRAVIAFLWRRSQRTIEPQDAQKPNA